jgi:hypothetical protein
MISGTYITAGVLLIISASMFKAGMLNATTQTIWWAVVFFFASAGASAGYLTASEVFPLEVRAQSIAVFFAIAQLFGAFGSHWYGHLIGNGTDRNSLFIGYLVGVAAEGKPLEDVAKPLSVIGKPAETIFRSGSDRGGVDPIAPGARSMGSRSVPDPRLSEHDDRARMRPDDGTPLT